VDGLDLYSLRRQNALLAQRLEFLEAILERSGIIDQVLGGVGGPSVDPGPEDLARAGGIAGRWGGWVSDPAPDDLGRPYSFGRLIDLLRGGRWPRPGDPSPVDISRFTKVQLEAALHTLAAERTRLDSMESLVKEQIKQVGKG
jgi:hypothetical protein